MRYALILAATIALAQDSREALGPKDNPKAKGENPLTKMIREQRPQLLPALAGVHPRVFVTSAELAALRERAKGSHAALWHRAMAGVDVYLKTEPPPPPAIERRAQNNVGLGIAALAFAYRIDAKPEYLAAARKYMDAAVSYEIWGYPNNKPNVDLAAGHLLYGLAWGYDLLYADLSPADRVRYREALRVHAKLLAEYFRPKPGRTIAYSQNHTFIPIAGLAIAAYALYDEVPEAPEWAAEARAIFDRTLETYSHDGYYYEGFEYWVFSTPWMVHYLDAHKHATGEDLYDQPGLRNAHIYVAHTVLPDGKNIFDFSDAFEGPNTRLGKTAEVERTHPGGHLNSNYNLLYRFAARFQSGEAQGVAAWLEKSGQVNAEDFWSLVWYDPAVAAIPIEKQTAWHYFPDHEVVFWRSAWTRDATALAIKCGPPEGHASAALAKKFPDWHLESGHAHPDAGSFILFAHGKYITGDSGYAGIPKSDQHNTLLIDGKGQEMPGATHNAFIGAPLDRLDRIRIVSQQMDALSLKVSVDFTAAYPPELGVQSVLRNFTFRGHSLRITDSVSTANPVTITSLLHFDADPPAFSMRILFPHGELQTIEPNIVTAPGPPGAVDKGPKEDRGMRMAISPGTSARSEKLSLVVSIN